MKRQFTQMANIKKEKNMLCSDSYAKLNKTDISLYPSYREEF